MRASRLPAVVLLLAVPPCLAPAAAAPPEIERPPAAPQGVGAVHTLRAIPEACARLEGAFTGEAALPYRFTAVRTGPGCQPRARFVDAARAQPTAATGWVVNDVIRVPAAGCPGQQAVVTVWRKPGQARAPELDAQGRARIYLGEARQRSTSGDLAAVDAYAAGLELDGSPCR